MALVVRLSLSVGVICYHVPSGRWLFHARNRSSSRVLFRDILFRISLYKSWTPAEVHGTRPPRQLRASNGIVFLFIVRIVPHYRSLEIALYLPKRGVEPRWVLQLFIVTIFVYIIAMPFLRLVHTVWVYFWWSACQYFVSWRVHFVSNCLVASWNWKCTRGVNTSTATTGIFIFFMFTLVGRYHRLWCGVL